MHSRVPSGGLDVFTRFLERIDECKECSGIKLMEMEATSSDLRGRLHQCDHRGVMTHGHHLRQRSAASVALHRRNEPQHDGLTRLIGLRQRRLRIVVDVRQKWS